MKNTLYCISLLLLIGVATFMYQGSFDRAEVNDDTNVLLQEESVSDLIPGTDEIASDVAPQFAILRTPYEVEDLTILLTEVIEDSRCPVDVTCIQAGTVRVRGLVSTIEGSFERTFVLGQPVPVSNQMVTLYEVIPRSVSTGIITNEQYQFYFSTAK